MNGQPLVAWLRDVTMDDVPEVGGKNASLGEMIRALSGAGVNVPDGFAVTAGAFRAHMKATGLDREVMGVLEHVDLADTRALAAAGQKIRAGIQASALSDALRTDVMRAYHDLSRRYGEAETDVAVRSSATAEDLPSASFAGQHETYLNVRGERALDEAVRACMSSLFTDRAIVYRAGQGIGHEEVALSVGVQKMVRSDLASAGVIFTLDTESGFRDVVLINGSWGLGEVIVKGRVNPDEYWVHKPTAAAGFRSIVRRELGDKRVKLVYGDVAGRDVKEVMVPERDRDRFVLNDDEVLRLARWAMAVEEHYSKRAGRPTPMDLEWAKDGHDGEVYIVQARPETVHAKEAAPQIEMYKVRGKGRVLISGKSVGSKVGAGAARRIASAAELGSFRPGEVLVAGMTDPDWEPVLKHAAAVVTDQGGRTCHAAIVSREHGIPCVVGTGHGTETLADGQMVTVSCAEGDVGKVYDGRVEFDREEIDPATLPTPRVPLMLNIGSPATAFRLAQLPSAGVGLMRIEFVISNWVGVHPMALVHPERVADDATRAEIRRRARGSVTLPEFFVDRLATGVAQIAAAFFPRPVIVRFSDFKTNEYAGLMGGRGFEPEESNPMIGFRGASRYYDERYREGFALECAALKRVREEMGLVNVKVMIPFCRTLEEARRVLEEMKLSGLERGKNGLEVYVMCEIPNNVVLGEEFAELFDGFSIGSNDLTQLALGVDRDSEILSHVFDERDPGVKLMIELVVAAAHRKRRKIGICGQAPSDYPEFAEWLTDIGIDSISLNPDSLAGVARRLARADAREGSRPAVVRA